MAVVLQQILFRKLFAKHLGVFEKFALFFLAPILGLVSEYMR